MLIRVLPPAVAARIAAGEVVERPASIVKELLENALDAGARRITVQIERGGAGLIRVLDDGHGIPQEELAVALERHATSKLTDDAELDTIATLGFRGEALPSIASAADMEIVSRTATGDGAEIRVRAGVVGPVRPAAAAAGTAVVVRDLFARQPARRKFLKSAAAESAAVAAAVSQAALAWPEVAFSLSIDGRRTFFSPGNGDPREAVAAVHGAASAGRMLQVGADEGFCSVRGLIAPPDLTRSVRSAISLFVNRRPVQSRRLAYAVESGYETMLMTGRHPLAVLDLSLAPGEVDVNVHPAKTEVRFRSEQEVFRIIQSAVRAALATHAPAPVFGLPATRTGSSASWWNAAPRDDAPPRPLAWWTPAPGTLPERVAPEPEPAPPREVLPVLRVIGQVGTTYVITEGPEGMYLIDQHAAHERVLYEHIVRARSRQAPDVQPLLDPLPFEPSPAQAAVVGDYREHLDALGFQLEDFGERSLLLRAVPAALAGGDPARALSDFLDEIAAGAPTTERAERAAMTLACHAAVRAGKTLAQEEMRELIRLLEACEAPRTCPHGRPTMIHVSAAALEREFGRRG